MKNEIEKVIELTGADENCISVNELGWTSRTYIINDGEIVFKFARNKEAMHDLLHETKVLEQIKDIDFGVKFPSVNWTNEYGEFVGFYGVRGKPFAEIVDLLDEKQQQKIGKQIGVFLKKLHTINGDNILVTVLNQSDILQYQNLYKKAKQILLNYFNAQEMEIIENLFNNEMPRVITELGQDLVFSHGDLGYYNIILDDAKMELGVIDFGDSAMCDRSKDFSGLSGTVLESAINSYGGNYSLFEKVNIRQKVLPIFHIEYFQRNNNIKKIKKHVEILRSRVFGT